MKNVVRKSLAVTILTAGLIAVMANGAQAADSPEKVMHLGKRGISVQVGECNFVGFMHIGNCTWSHVHV